MTTAARAGKFAALSLMGVAVVPYAHAEEFDRPDYPSRVFWGDTHVHTYLSADAFALGTRLTPDDAYRFAKGEAVVGTGGSEARLRSPLDFLLIADHAENLGVLPKLVAADGSVPDSEDSRHWRKTLADLAPLREVLEAESIDDYREKAKLLLAAKKASSGDYLLDEDVMRSVWQSIVAAAEEHNQPGTFTTFVGYEWSANDGAMIHRNVLFADGPEVTGKILPFSSFDSVDVEDLWAFLKYYEDEHGGSAIAIPHNGNLSRGTMFKLSTADGAPLTAAYANERARWEPIYEVTQIKGDGETHRDLSPGDEYADFETWPPPVFDRGPADEQANYARSALKQGLKQEAMLGTNPFKFGMIGSTDSHTALATADEDLFWGKMGLQEPSAFRAIDDWFYSASGYAAVWATANTRDAIFAAFKRRETYATTGPRMTVRFFGGWDFKKGDEHAEDLADTGYRNGVPMGGDLTQAPKGGAPRFIVRAIKDPTGAHLDRIQIIKGWLDADGALHEKIYDVAEADDGGDELLDSVWQDPDFDEESRAFYYARVIQVPSPRWTAYDAERFDLELPEGVPATVQDRAYTSPIWYTPR